MKLVTQFAGQLRREAATEVERVRAQLAELLEPHEHAFARSAELYMERQRQKATLFEAFLFLYDFTQQTAHNLYYVKCSIYLDDRVRI